MYPYFSVDKQFLLNILVLPYRSLTFFWGRVLELFRWVIK
jgi:hypothetical protein